MFVRNVKQKRGFLNLPVRCNHIKPIAMKLSLPLILQLYKNAKTMSFKEYLDWIKVRFKPEMIHIIYTYEGIVYQAYKFWDFDHAERVLERLGATYWEIGLDERSISIKGIRADRLIK